jgi:hypothetical protein
MSLLEIPYWVPHGDTSIAACLTMPPDPSRLVALLQVGGGVPRTHRNRAWVHAARQLGDRGVATVRMDYPGTGDSTGEAALSLDRPPADAVIAVIEHAQRVTGIDRVGVAGQCLGVRAAIEAASAIAACDRLALVMPVTLRPALRGSEGPRLAAVRKATAGRFRRLKRRARQRWDHLDVRRGADLDPAIGAIASHANVLLLHGGTGASGGDAGPADRGCDRIPRPRRATRHEGGAHRVVRAARRLVRGVSSAQARLEGPTGCAA